MIVLLIIIVHFNPNISYDGENFDSPSLLIAVNEIDFLKKKVYRVVLLLLSYFKSPKQIYQNDEVKQTFDFFLDMSAVPWSFILPNKEEKKHIRFGVQFFWSFYFTRCWKCPPSMLRQSLDRFKTFCSTPLMVVLSLLAATSLTHSIKLL